MTTITLTEYQRLAIKAEMEQQTSMLSDDEVEALASKLNATINIPFIKEGTEQTILVKIVRKFDRLLYQHLPNELYRLVKDAQDGISDADAAELSSVLAARLNPMFDIPFIPEGLEQNIFELLVGLVVTAMRKQFSILQH